MKWVLRIVNVVQVLLMSAFCVWLSIKVESDCGLSDCGFLKSMMSIVAIVLVLVAGRLLFKGDMIGNMKMNDGWSAVMSAILLVLFIAECFLDGVTMWGWVIVLPYCLLDIGAWTIRKETGL